MFLGKPHWMWLLLTVLLSNEGFAQDIGVEQIGEMMKVVVKQYFTGCHLILLTTLPHVAIVTAMIRYSIYLIVKLRIPTIKSNF